MEYYNPSKAIAATYRLGQAILRLKLKSLGIQIHQADFLYALSKMEGITQQKLSEILMISKASVGEAAKNMTALGYVERVPSADDRRALCLYLTEKGRDIAPLLDEAFSALITIHEGALTDEENAQFRNLIMKMMNRLSEEKNTLSNPQRNSM